MVVVTRSIRALSLDGADRQHVQIEAGTKVKVLKRVGPNVVCSLGIPKFTSYLVIPANALVQAQEEEVEEERTEKAQLAFEKREIEKAEKLEEESLIVSERPEFTREEIQEPEVWAIEDFQLADVEELEEVALHKQHLTSEEFSDYLQDKIVSLDTPLAKRLKRILQKRTPDLSEDELQQKMREIYEQHADKEFIQRIQRGIEVEKKQVEEKVRPVKPSKIAPGGPMMFEIPPEARRMLPKRMKERYGRRPFGTLKIPGHEGRFQIEQIDPYSSITSLRDIKTMFYDQLGSPELAHRKAVQIITNENEIESNPMPINSRSGMSEITHEGYVIQRQYDQRKQDLDYIFFHPRRRSQTHPAGSTLKEAKEIVDTYVLGRVGEKETALAD